MPETMRAIRLTGPVDSDGLTVSDVPIPGVRPGWVRIRVMAFGVNESEVTSRKGESDPEFTFPRILGIEAVGVVDAVGDGVDLAPGQKVATMMGGLGRSIDGSYAEYTLVDAANVIPFDSDLPWEIVGAIPQMVQTAHGSLTTGLQLQTGQTVLIRGGTSTVGLTAIALAHQIGAAVIATTRNQARFDLLQQVGADHTVLDDDTLPNAVRELAPTGLDAAVRVRQRHRAADDAFPCPPRRHSLLRRRPRRRLDHPRLLPVRDPHRGPADQLRRRSKRPPR